MDSREANASISLPPAYEQNAQPPMALSDGHDDVDAIKRANQSRDMPDSSSQHDAGESEGAGIGGADVPLTANVLQKEAAARQGSICGVPKRLILVLLSCLGLAISYADRSNIAIAIIPMSKEFGWTPAIEGTVFSCFFYGYMATQILGGYLADKFGGKWVFGAGKS